jgi:hypothetical protein
MFNFNYFENIVTDYLAEKAEGSIGYKNWSLDVDILSPAKRVYRITHEKIRKPALPAYTSDFWEEANPTVDTEEVAERKIYVKFCLDTRINGIPSLFPHEQYGRFYGLGSVVSYAIATAILHGEEPELSESA